MFLARRVLASGIGFLPGVLPLKGCHPTPAFTWPLVTANQCYCSSVLFEFGLLENCAVTVCLHTFSKMIHARRPKHRPAAQKGWCGALFTTPYMTTILLSPRKMKAPSKLRSPPRLKLPQFGPIWVHLQRSPLNIAARPHCKGKQCCQTRDEMAS